MWSYEEETKKVISATEELGVVIAAYSCVCPLFVFVEACYLTPPRIVLLDVAS